MSTEESNVHRLEAVQQESQVEEEVVEQQDLSTHGLVETQKDMSKVAMIVSLLAVILLVIFFFGMNKNIAGLTDEVKSLSVLRDDVSNLDQRMVLMQQEMPSQVKRMIAYDLVNEMTMKAAYLGDSLEDEVLRKQMQDVLQSLKNVREGLVQ
jgi:predicted PurR-regulated permease PerM